MIFHETALEGAYLIEPEYKEDERGFFARVLCKKEFNEHVLISDFVQCNISFNHSKGTLRGIHYQISPYEEVKIVRCTMGIIYDVIIDLRPNSRSYKMWFSTELSSENRMMIYIPEGFAHGFLTLTDNTEVYYQMSEYYMPGYDCGIRWNDPEFNIKWISDVAVISEKDSKYPLWKR